MHIRTIALRALSAAALATALAAVCTPGTALAEGPGTEGRKVGETIFASIDTSGRGSIHTGDLEQFRASVFSGMDYDDDGRVTYAEFAGWDPGFADIAEQDGRSDAYTTASKVVFAFWDRNGDGNMTETEMRFAMNADFRRADTDDDGLLTRDEFLQGFPIMIAMRAALSPNP